MKITRGIVVLLLLVLLAACQGTNMNNDQSGGLIGAGSGGLLGGLLGNSMGHHSGTSTALGAGLGAIAGYFVGSSIGANLDANARKKAQGATEQVLDEPIKRQDGKAIAKKKTWNDQNSGTHGSSQITKVDTGADGGECRTVKEVAYIKGQEVDQTSKYCRNASGQWEAARST